MYRRNDFDVLVIGAGSAGFSAALAARKNGAKVGIIERDKLGGECPNAACIPTKFLWNAAGKKSWKTAIAEKDAVVRQVAGSRLSGILEREGVSLIRGNAVFLDAHTVKAGAHEWTAERFVIAGGAETIVPDIPGLVAAGYLTYGDVVNLKGLPKSIAILGGGPVGVEFATILHGFGVRVTLLEREKRLLPEEEPEISSVIEERLRSSGVQIYAGAECYEVKKMKSGRELMVRQGRMEFAIETETVLLATGKRSLARSMKAERAGVQLEEQGCILVDAYLRAGAKHIFAAGDVKCGPQYTHISQHDGRVAGHNASSKRLMKTDHAVVPRVTFGPLEVASVGLTERQAREAHGGIRVGRAYYAGTGPALVSGERDGLVKVIVDAKTGIIRGASVVGMSASGLMHEAALAMKLGATADDIADMMHAYPTVSEILAMACGNIE